MAKEEDIESSVKVGESRDALRSFSIGDGRAIVIFVKKLSGKTLIQGDSP